MENIKQFYDETNVDYVKRIYENIIKKSVTSAVVNISENMHNLKLDDEFKLKLKKAAFISGMVALGATSVNVSKQLSNPAFRNNVKMSIEDMKEDVKEKSTSLTDKIDQALSTQAVDNNNSNDIFKETQDRLTGKTVNYPTSPNTDIIGFAKLIVSSGEGMNGDLYNFYINHSQDTFNKLIESIIFIDPSIDENVVKDFNGYLKMKGFNSIEEWIEFSKNESENKGVSISK